MVLRRMRRSRLTQRQEVTEYLSKNLFFFFLNKSSDSPSGESTRLFGTIDAKCKQDLVERCEDEASI